MSTAYCVCGKIRYASADAAHRAHQAHTKRRKYAKHSKRTFRRDGTQPGSAPLGVYRCEHGWYHRGHVGEH